MRDFFYERDKGIGDFEGWDSGIITLTNREPGSPLTRIYKVQKKPSPSRSRFQGIAFHFYPHNAKVKLNPLKTSAWEAKKSRTKVDIFI